MERKLQGGKCIKSAHRYFNLSTQKENIKNQIGTDPSTLNFTRVLLLLLLRIVVAGFPIFMMILSFIISLSLSTSMCFFFSSKCISLSFKGRWHVERGKVLFATHLPKHLKMPIELTTVRFLRVFFYSLFFFFSVLNVCQAVRWSRTGWTEGPTKPQSPFLFYSPLVRLWIDAFVNEKIWFVNI